MMLITLALRLVAILDLDTFAFAALLSMKLLLSWKALIFKQLTKLFASVHCICLKALRISSETVGYGPPARCLSMAFLESSCAFDGTFLTKNRSRPCFYRAAVGSCFGISSLAAEPGGGFFCSTSFWSLLATESFNYRSTGISGTSMFSRTLLTRSALDDLAGRARFVLYFSRRSKTSSASIFDILSYITCRSASLNFSATFSL